jgi:hypothetical protein
MGIEKSELKALAVSEVGKFVEELGNGATDELLRCEGRMQGCQASAKAVLGLMEHVTKDLESGAVRESLGDLKGQEAAVAAAKLIQKWLQHAHGAIDSIATKAQVQTYHERGKIDMADKVHAHAKKLVTEELKKAEALKAVPEQDQESDAPRAPGSRPKLSDAQVRRQEAAAKKKATKKKAAKDKE